MIEVGIRELKSHLSDYVRMLRRGEVIAVKIRREVVGFLSSQKPLEAEPKKGRGFTKSQLKKKIEEWKKAGILLSGGLGPLPPFKGERLSGDKRSDELLREMRDEEP